MFRDNPDNLLPCRGCIGDPDLPDWRPVRVGTPAQLRLRLTPTEPEADPPVSDAVNRPHHYARYKIEPIHFIRENELPFWMGNVVKYVLRADAKNGLEDLKKARRYLDMEIARAEGHPDWSA